MLAADPLFVDGVDLGVFVVVLLKTRKQDWAALLSRLHDLHPYETPELLAVRVAVGLEAVEDLARLRPDLDGNEIMEILGIPAGPQVGEAWHYLKELRLDRGPLTREEDGGAHGDQHVYPS